MNSYRANPFTYTLCNDKTTTNVFKDLFLTPSFFLQANLYTTPFKNKSNSIRDIDSGEAKFLNYNPTKPVLNYLHSSSVTSFFVLNQVDTPLIFSKSNSLFMKSFELPILHFTNLFMRGGSRELIMKILSTTLTMRNKTSSPSVAYWLSDLIIFQKNLNLSNFSLTQFHTKLVTSPSLNNRSSITNGDEELFKTLTLIFFDKFKDYTPIFNFFIKKVDKKIRKYSRGKSGKYSLVWKYVPIYKRLYTVMRWFYKEVKFQKALNFSLKFKKTIQNFLKAPNKTLLNKWRIFTHAFTFINYKKSLLSTLQSVG